MSLNKPRRTPLTILVISGLSLSDWPCRGAASISRLLLQQFICFDTQSTRQLCDVVDGDVAFAALYGTDVSAVQSGPIGQFFLGDSLLRPQGAKIEGQDFSLLRDIGGFLLSIAVRRGDFL